MNDRCWISLLVLAVVGCATIPKADQDLFAAVKADNAGGVERAVATGANVNGKHVGQYVGASALGWAGVWGSMNSAEWLVAHGADVDGANEHGSTPLHLAAYNLQPAVAGLLIRHGAAVNARSEVGWTPLHKAMERLAEAPGTRTPADEEVAKATRIVELLLTSGADINIRGVEGISPLHVAAGTGQKRLVQLLVDRGADAKGASVDGVTPLFVAAGRNVGEVAALLIAQGGDVNARTKRGFTALTAAAGSGNPAVAEVLVEHGADIGLRDKDGFTALLSACRSLLFEYTLRASTPGAQDLRRKLLGRGGARSVAEDGEELRRAKGDFSAVAILLLEHGADPTDGLGDFLPLQTAALGVSYAHLPASGAGDGDRHDVAVHGILLRRRRLPGRRGAQHDNPFGPPLRARLLVHGRGDRGRLLLPEAVPVQRLLRRQASRNARGLRTHASQPRPLPVHQLIADPNLETPLP